MNSEQLVENLKKVKKGIEDFDYTLIAVSKTKPLELVKAAYDAGQLDFGENKVQDLLPKYEALPKDIHWHFIGHLQRNKVKAIAPFVHLIHSVDSLRLLKEVNKQGEKNDRVVNCLLQIHIAKEESKFGLDFQECRDILINHLKELPFVNIKGLMGMATNTENSEIVREEFRSLKLFFDSCKKEFSLPNFEAEILSLGMSQDYKIALEEGSNMIRVGSLIFGARNYA